MKTQTVTNELYIVGQDDVEYNEFLQRFRLRFIETTIKKPSDLEGFLIVVSFFILIL